jgi:hypothetical protein
MLKNSKWNLKKKNWVLVLIKDLWTWTTITSKVVNFVESQVKDSLYKGILMKKNWDDVTWLSTLKKHVRILKFQESFNTCKWGVMYMTYQTKL